MRWLEGYAKLAGVDGDCEEDRVSHGELTAARDELGIGGREDEERMHLAIDAAAVVDLDRARLGRAPPRTTLILSRLEEVSGHRSGAARAEHQHQSCELWSLSQAQSE